MKDRLSIKVIHKEDDGIYAFALKGSIDLVGAKGLEGLSNACERQGINRVVFDVSGVKNINAPGLGALLDFARELEGRGGKLLLVNMPQMIRQFFHIHDVLNHFTTKISLDAALDELKTGKA